MPSAFAASGDITDSIVYLSLGDDGSGDLQLQAYGPGGEVLSPTVPVRVPSSNAYEIPAGQDWAWLGKANQSGWGLLAEEFPSITFQAISWNEDVFYDDHGDPISVPVTWRLKDVVAPKAGTYSAYETPFVDGSLLPVDSELRFGTGVQRDGSPQDSSFVDPSNPEEPAGPYTQFFTAQGMYCVNYEVELTLPGESTPLVRDTTVRYAVGDGVPSDAECGSDEWVDPEPEPDADPDVGEAKLSGRVWDDANKNGAWDEGETVFPGMNLEITGEGNWGNVPVPEPMNLVTDSEGKYEARVRTTPQQTDAAIWRIALHGLPDGFNPLTLDYVVQPGDGKKLVHAFTTADLSVDGAAETVDFALKKIGEDDAYVLRGGHADVLYPELEKDASGAEFLKLRAHVDRVDGVLDYDDMVIHVDGGHEQQLPARYTEDADFSFIGPEGSTFWNASEGPGEPWIGAAMQSPTLEGLADKQLFSLSLDNVTGPGGSKAPGDVVLWDGDVRTKNVFMSTRSGPARARNFALGTHSHFNWSFTNEGVYCLAISAQTPGRDGTLLRDAQQLTLVVGDTTDPATVEPCGRTQPYPERLTGSYLDAEGAAPFIKPYSRVEASNTTGAVAGVRFGGGQLVAESLRWLPFTEGKITANPLKDSIFYTPQDGEAGRNSNRPYPVNIPKWDTTAIAPSDIQGSANFTITKINGPGQLTGGGGWQNITAIDTAAGKTSLEMWPASVSDVDSWDVTRPGKYCVIGEWSAATATGEKVTTTEPITLVAEGPLDPTDYRSGRDGYVSDGEVWRASEHGALDATCAQDPDSWTRASEVPVPGDNPDPQDAVPLPDKDGNVLFAKDWVASIAEFATTIAATDQVIAGDWDGDGVDTFALRYGNEYSFLATNRPDASKVTATLGEASDAVVVGDVNGDGKDDLALRTDGTNEFAIYYGNVGTFAAAPDLTVYYGKPTDIPLAGDWDGDGKASLGIQRDNRFYLRNALSGGVADVNFTYGRAGDVPLTGDFDGDGRDTVAVARGYQVFAKNAFTGGAADIALGFGRSSDTRIVGDFFGSGTDTPAVVR